MKRKSRQKVQHNGRTFAEPVQSYSFEKRLREEALDWFASEDFQAVPITISYYQYLPGPSGTKQRLDVAMLEKSLKLLLMRATKFLFGGQAVKKGVRLEGQFVWEDGDNRGLHTHGRVRLPPGVSAEQLEKALVEACFGMEWISEVRCESNDAYAWIRYMTKHKDSGSLIDHIDLTNTRWR